MEFEESLMVRAGFEIWVLYGRNVPGYDSSCNLVLRVCRIKFGIKGWTWDGCILWMEYSLDRRAYSTWRWGFVSYTFI